MEKNGVPASLLHDNGREISNILVSQALLLCASGMANLTIRPYNKKAQGKIERSYVLLFFG